VTGHPCTPCRRPAGPGHRRQGNPIYQTAWFTFPDSDCAATLFNIERAGHVYSRLSNPTNAVLEERLPRMQVYHRGHLLGTALVG
jgi:O-acetylhomoserine/O-acetylserine sulfhydrylase-like pyridoxal-dependent enzyme